MHNTYFKISEVTFAVGGVQCLVSLNKDVTEMKRNQYDFLQFHIWKPSSQVDMLTDVGILTEVSIWDLKPV